MRQTTDVRYLIVPGWQGSPAEHWQSHWQQVLPECTRVEQDDWLLPQRQAWIAQLEAQIAADQRPVVLIAHSLGCVTVAHWAAQASAGLLARVRGALLVAPADVERIDCPAALVNFAPIPTEPLPFPSVLIGSSNDHAADAQRAVLFARQWGSTVTILSQAGHINVQSGHHRWEQGFAWLYQLQERSDRGYQRSA
ncbi:alpha/beta hydrolase [Pseudomonas sp. C27(2019)]|uniref:RBBP9/YdeN family alpha/beta hydrolase n=1 Tax=Pseudomonas sp. C27(2019) TaxID=2604941 RepID=UPI0012468BA3|nr:alpha/beta hydrolase [Pseudomonas sp. C27(2019)]QEY58794.1 alpha/beta hydrolase [Pseudomonas sp. C27(2019)]